MRLASRFPRWSQYFLTVALVFVCLELDLLLSEVATYYVPRFLLFMLVIILSSFLFGRGAGFLATILSSLMVTYFLLPPYYTFAPHGLGEITGLAVFLFSGFLTAAIIEALHETVNDLAEKNSLLEAVVQGSPDPIFAKDLRGRYVLANSAAVQILGAKQDDIRNKTDREILPPEIAGKVEDIDRDVMLHGRVRVEEENMAKAGEKPHVFMAKKVPWYGPKGDIVGLIGIAREIGRLKRA